MFSKAVLLAFFTFTAGSRAAGNFGLVGLGRTYLEPLCCYACLSSLWALQLDCPQAPNLDPKHGLDPSCHSTNAIYLSSLAYCMQTKCQADGLTTNATEQCWSKVAGDGAQVSSLEDNLPTVAPTSELAYGATTLDQISLVNEQYYSASIGTIKQVAAQETAHALYGFILMMTVVGCCILLGLHRLKDRFMPFLALPRFISIPISKYITEPALIGTKHLKRIPANLGYVPSRALTLIILIYLALNIFLSVYNLPTISPDTFYIKSSKQLISFAANRLGVLSFANIAITIMFSGRNTPLLWITGASRSDILTFHRWVSRLAAIQGVIHVALYWTNTKQTGYNMFTTASDIRVVNYNPSYWTFGIGAVIAMVFLVVLFSAAPIRIKFYETFLVLHIIFVAGTLIGLWYHVTMRYHKAYGYEVWLYIAFSFWGFDRLARPVRMMVLNWRSWIQPKFPNAIVELLPGEEFMKVIVFPSLTWKATAGQYCFLYFPTSSGNPFQSHPFSIASWSNGLSLVDTDNNVTGDDEASNLSLPLPPPPPLYKKQDGGGVGDLFSSSSSEVIELPSLPFRIQHNPKPISQHQHHRPSITFLLRPHHGLTQSLHHSLLKTKNKPSTNTNPSPSPPATTHHQIPVFIEGPYTSTPPLSAAAIYKADTIVAIAGGIGITSILSYLQLYLETLSSSSSSSSSSCSLLNEVDVRGKGRVGGRGERGRATRFILNWSVREESLVGAVGEMIGELGGRVVMGDRGVVVNIVRTGGAEGVGVGEWDRAGEGQGEGEGRMDVRRLIRDEVQAEENKGKRVCVISCGPGGMSDEVRGEVVACLGGRDMNVASLELVEEAFCW